MVLHFIGESAIQQRLVCLEFPTKSMNGEELARELRNLLSLISSNKQ